MDEQDADPSPSSGWLFVWPEETIRKKEEKEGNQPGSGDWPFLQRVSQTEEEMDEPHLPKSHI